ncbi:MAG: DegT/DnrJ/EryC1/StrS family aminotransferase [Acidimicrobiaceae bacterium]
MPIIENVLASGNYVGGEVVDQFEIAISKFLGSPHCVAVNSCTDALVLGLAALGVRRGDEVITPPNSFIASTAAIVHLGATPVFVDVLPNQSIDPNLVEKAITKKTKAIMPVHLGGRMADMDQISRIADSYGIAVIEDAAQSIGSTFNGILSGTFGDVGCFSAHPLKNLNALGDGGFVCFKSQEMAEEVKKLRSHGLIDRNTVEMFGYVSRLDAVQAAVLTFRLTRLAEIIKSRRANAELYRSLLNPEYVFVPDDDPRERNSYHTFVVQVDRREELIAHLLSCGIGTAIHYPIPIHLQPAAKFLGFGEGSFPVTEKQAKRILTLPINQHLKEQEIETIAQTVNSFYGR